MTNGNTSLSSGLSETDTTIGTPVTISGTLTVPDPGTCADGSFPFDNGNGVVACGDGSTPSTLSAAGKTVFLQAATFPTANYATVAQTRTDDGGYYTFTVRANLTANYRVVITAMSLTSAPMLLSSEGAFGQQYAIISGNLFQGLVNMTGPKTLNLSKYKAVWYARSNSKKEWTRVGYSQLKNVGAGKTKTSIRAKMPSTVNTRKAWRWSVCFMLPPKTTPLGNPADPACPTAATVPTSNKALG